MRDPSSKRRRSDIALRLRMRSLMIYPATRGRSSCREPINRYPGQNLVISPGIAIGPIMQLFVDPSEQCDWTIFKCITNRLRFSGLQEIVAEAFLIEPRGTFKAGFLSVVVRVNGVLQSEYWVCRKFRCTTEY